MTDTLRAIASTKPVRLGERFDTGFLPSNIEPTHFICRDCGDSFTMDAECGIPNGQAGVYVGRRLCIVRRFCKRCVDARYAGKPNGQSAGTAARNQSTSNTMKQNTKLEATTAQSVQAAEPAAICSPCSLPCPKCGSTDIHRAYRKAADRGDYNHDMPDRLDKSKPTHPIYPIKTEYILHICRCCSYRWGTDTLARTIKSTIAILKKPASNKPNKGRSNSHPDKYDEHD